MLSSLPETCYFTRLSISLPSNSNVFVPPELLLESSTAWLHPPLLRCQGSTKKGKKRRRKKTKEEEEKRKENEEKWVPTLTF
ncbi:hypothetical protein WN944_027671 [Citrus x changshan-huyou]|uniref:Uncharacterized protein n=1 Tax=Citrus x changshan-huyou TaxID=2935761 RepID=A0AAP0LP81_9ROSI